MPCKSGDMSSAKLKRSGGGGEESVGVALDGSDLIGRFCQFFFNGGYCKCWVSCCGLI